MKNTPYQRCFPHFNLQVIDVTISRSLNPLQRNSDAKKPEATLQLYIDNCPNLFSLLLQPKVPKAARDEVRRPSKA